MKQRLALGLDFGTEAVRALLVDCASGELAGTAVAAYEHGVIDEVLEPAHVRLPADFALQVPRDYLDAMVEAVRTAIREAAIDPGSVVGIGVDFTACTMLPVDAGLRPLCEQDDFSHIPHAYVKLWKHHGANAQADRINQLATERGEAWLARYGGTTSSEWMLAKAWETLANAPAVYDAADLYLEASDWVVSTLCGELVRGACAAGYRGMWLGSEGFVGEAFLGALDPGLCDFFSGKLRGPVRPAGICAGGLTAVWAERLGLPEGVALESTQYVATRVVDLSAPGRA